MNYKVKIVVGFRKEQFYTIDAEEAHKAYYLFLHPEERGIFSNGVALVGKNIQQIEPDYNATMGWNPEHKLDTDDWSELRAKKVDSKIQTMLAHAKDIAHNSPHLLSVPLSTAILELPVKEEVIKLANKFSINQ